MTADMMIDTGEPVVFHPYYASCYQLDERESVYTDEKPDVMVKTSTLSEEDSRVADVVGKARRQRQALDRLRITAKNMIGRRLTDHQLEKVECLCDLLVPQK